MSSVDLTEIHGELLVLLDKLHEICVANDIHYSLHGGTLLGAVREKGFIPWDDDADVTLTRAEFEKFKKVVRETDLGPEFRYDEMSRYPKLIMKREGKTVVWADIFIYDFISENRLARKLKLLGNYFFVLFTRTREEQKLSNVHGLYSGVKKFAMNAIVAVGSLFPMSWRLKLATASMKSFPGRKNYIHRANDQYVGIHMTLPTGVMEEYTIVPFETTELMISARYDEILTSSYGPDYMTPRQDKPEEMHALSLKNEQNQFTELFQDKG